MRLRMSRRRLTPPSRECSPMLQHRAHTKMPWHCRGCCVLHSVLLQWFRCHGLGALRFDCMYCLETTKLGLLRVSIASAAAAAQVCPCHMKHSKLGVALQRMPCIAVPRPTIAAAVWMLPCSAEPHILSWQGHLLRRLWLCGCTSSLSAVGSHCVESWACVASAAPCSRRSQLMGVPCTDVCQG